MNEEHIISAILTAGVLARQTREELTPKDVVDKYQMILTELLSVTRPARGSKENPAASASAQ